MRLPYPVVTLDDTLRDRWDTYFAGEDHDRPRYVEEGIWRRTQEPANANQSGWADNSQSRRRIVHYRYRYGCGQHHLELQEFYLYYCLTVPKSEIDAQENDVLHFLERGGWARGGDEWRRGNLSCRLTRYTVHPKDREAGRSMPADHRTYEVVIRSDNCDLADNVINHPWLVLAGGMRIKDQRGNPTVVDDLSGIKDYLPFQVEVGCGTSFEAGVPPLHRLHEIYRVTSRNDSQPGTYSFTLDPDQDSLLREVLATPENKFDELAEMFRACFIAEPTPALVALRDMAGRGHLVGPVITNNFDVLTARAGLDECFVRRYDQTIPDIPLLPQARSLLVIGNHADRRKVQARARQQGMRIFFLDPEGFRLDGEFAPYPLESAQTGDILCRKEASDGLTELARLLSKTH